MFQRLVNLFRGFLGLFISGMEKTNPEALLEVEKENLRTQISRYNDGLASHAALCERLMSQTRQLEAEERDLRAKAGANLRAGNREAAAQYALRLQTVSRELEEDRKQLEQAETTYKNLVKARNVAVQSAKAKLETLKSTINDMKMKRALAELTEMSNSMIGSIGGSGDTMDRLTTMVAEERDKAAGRARVASEKLDFSGVDLQESEQKALADQALADFAAKEGIALGSAAAPGPAASKSMGPVAEKQ
jgi:phage shock protein A